MQIQQKQSSYHQQLQKVLAYQQLFRILLLKYKVCISCVYRIFSIMTPKIYSEETHVDNLCRQVIKIAQNKCMEEGVKEVYKFLFVQFKARFEEGGMFNSGEFCWLCSGILQREFLEKCAKLSIATVKQQQYVHKTKYKLNVKIGNLLNIKFQVFCNLMLAQIQSQQLISKPIIQQIRKQLIVPLFQKTGLDIKTVFKWKLSHIINQQPSQIFTLCSTINQDQQSVIISLQIDHNSQQLQQCLTNLLGPYLQLTKAKHKKSRIQLNQDIHYQAVWTQGLIMKMLQIVPMQWMVMGEMKIIDKVRKMENNGDCMGIKIGLESQNIFFSGKYVKFSRYLSQTPWVINKERLTESSLQELVQAKILRFFYPEGIPESKIVVKFHAGGREDIDVRMLKGGRPFVLQFVNPRRCLSDIKISTIIQTIRSQYPEQSKKLPAIQDTYQGMQADLLKCNLLQFYINSSTQLAKVNSFKRTDSSFISKQLKQAQIQKIKHYVCYIKSIQDFTKEDKIKLEQCYNLPVLQKTPVRVLHRRTLMYRDKVIHKMIFHQVSRKSAVLEIWASAGTYIKEFVHGDLNRTVPNVGTLIGKEVDILQLDVGSLKEGEWEQGAHQNMKLGKLAWEES